MHEAKSRLSELVEAAERGEEIVIARAGKPVARLAPIVEERRRLGRWRGKVVMSASFDDPLPPEEVELWDGGR